MAENEKYESEPGEERFVTSANGITVLKKGGGTEKQEKSRKKKSKTEKKAK